MVKQLVTNKFDAFVKKTFHNKEELKKFCLNHEKRAIFIDNLCEQIKKVEEQNIKLDDARITDLTESMAKLFCLTALQVKEREIRSDASRIQSQDNSLSI